MRVWHVYLSCKSLFADSKYDALVYNPQAIRLYQNCLKKFHGGRDPSLHIYLAHAYFDARQYNDCMRVLLKALHVSPNNLQLWYNLALARETFAVAVLQKEQKGEARTLAEVENAIEDLKVNRIHREHVSHAQKSITTRASSNWLSAKYAVFPDFG